MARILAKACITFREYGVEGITPDRGRIDKDVGESLMPVTALSPVIGYGKGSNLTK